MSALLESVADTYEIRNELTFTHRSFSGALRSVCCYVRAGDSLLVPRMHFQRPNADDSGIVDPSVSYFTASLKEYQQIPARIMYSCVARNGCALAHLFTGFGKTVVALWLVAALKPQCTIIYVHKKCLETQWKSQIKVFLSEEIASSVSVRTVQSQIRNMDQLAGYGHGTLFVFDEVHHMCARSFSQILFASMAQWHLGISATKSRADGLEGVLHAFLGKPCIELLDLHIKPHVYCSQFACDPDLHDVPMCTISGRKVVNFNAALDMLCASEKRNLHITSLLMQTGHRNVLVLTRRRLHAIHLFDMCRQMHGRDVRLLLGGMSSESFEMAIRAGLSIILIATTQVAGEGFDMPALDTILFATPSGNITQETGRVLRRAGANHPLVIDIVDSAPVYKSQFRKRSLFYKQQNVVFVNGL